MNKGSRSKKKLAGIVGVLAVAVIGGTMAFYTATLSVDNKLSTKGYGNEMVEKFTPKEDWQPGAEINKDVTVKNTGDYPLLARVTWSETWKKANNSTETLKLQQEIADADTSQVTKLLANENDWKYAENYYYYNGTIAKDGAIQFLDSITLKSTVDMTGTAQKEYYYSNSDTEPTTTAEWTKVANESDIPAEAKYRKVVSKSAEDSYGNAQYTLTITTEVMQATKEAVDGTNGWAPFKTVCKSIYDALPGNVE